MIRFPFCERDLKENVREIIEQWIGRLLEENIEIRLCLDRMIFGNSYEDKHGNRLDPLRVIIKHDRNGNVIEYLHHKE